MLCRSRAEEAAAARQGGHCPLHGALDGHSTWHRDEPCAEGTACAGATCGHAPGTICIVPLMCETICICPSS